MYEILVLTYPSENRNMLRFVSARSTIPYQTCCNVVTSMLQRELQWRPTLVILGVYNRTMLEQQARAFVSCLKP